jgi:hypothetical protein
MANSSSSRVSNRGNRNSTSNFRNTAARQRAHYNALVAYMFMMEMIRLHAPVNTIRRARNNYLRLRALSENS